MICFWPIFCILLLSIRCTLVIMYSEYLPNLNSLNDHYAEILSPSAAINTQEYSLEMTQTNKFGLPRCANERNECREIGIVGAGVAGLYCGILLAEAGHKVTIYEASDRAGGRISTYRDPSNSSKYIGELGAMRFPLYAHSYLYTLIRQRYQLNITDYDNDNDNTTIYINGIFATKREARENPDIFKFNTSESERGKTPDELWSKAIQPILETLAQEGWESVKNKWDSYSVQSFLHKMNMSPAAIDYFSHLENFETSLYVAILENVRPTDISISQSRFYSIEGGNDVLVRSMVNECQTMESNRCSILYSTPITQIELFDSNQIQLTTKYGMNQIFDTIIVATTATAASLIDFNPRMNFLDQYRAWRQLHYFCASKILLSFNVSWWYTQENINNGVSITDLNIRNVYYPHHQINGGTILVAYTFSQDSHIWASLSDSDAIELALKQLIQLHKSSSNLRDFFQGGKVHHWCKDPYSHGAFVSFMPLQETNLHDILSLSVSNIHFVGEHTSLMHGWVEGALSSAIRAVLSITKQKETIFDVIIIGGDPVGLATAVFLSMKQSNLRIAIIEKEILSNSDEISNAFDQRQFRQLYDEEYLSELTNMALPLWRQVEQWTNISTESILNIKDGYLLFGRNQSNIEGNLISIRRTCEHLQMGCEYLNNTELQRRYPRFSFSPEYQGIYHNQSGYINVTMLMKALLRIINQSSNIQIRQQEEFLSLKLDNQIQIVTDRGMLNASRKVLFNPGPYIKNVSHLLHFDLNVTLWELPVYYFRRLPIDVRFPTWFTVNDNHSQSLFASFSIDSTSDYIVIRPHFIQNISNPLIYPSQQTNIIDRFLTEKVIEWVSQHMRMMVNVSDYYSDNRTYLATFLPDHGFIVDYVPQTNNRVLIQGAGWGLEFVPVWADILSEMILFQINSSSKYAKYMDYLSISRPNRLIEKPVKSNQGYKVPSSLLLLLCLLILLNES